LKQLNLPEYSFSIRGKEGDEQIFDIIRKKYVKLTDEEWVRQNFIRYLVNEGRYPPGLIGVEVFFTLNNTRKRVDILVHNRKGAPVMIVECKSPAVQIDDTVFEQIATYNMAYKVQYLVVTNGLHHFACRLDADNKKFEYLLVIPLYEDLSDQ
jgi:hypothetical protein